MLFSSFQLLQIVPKFKKVMPLKVYVLMFSLFRVIGIVNLKEV